MVSRREKTQDSGSPHREVSSLFFKGQQRAEGDEGEALPRRRNRLNPCGALTPDASNNNPADDGSAWGV